MKAIRNEFGQFSGCGRSSNLRPIDWSFDASSILGSPILKSREIAKRTRKRHNRVDVVFDFILRISVVRLGVRSILFAFFVADATASLGTAADILHRCVVHIGAGVAGERIGANEADRVRLLLRPRQPFRIRHPLHLGADLARLRQVDDVVLGPLPAAQFAHNGIGIVLGRAGD